MINHGYHFVGKTLRNGNPVPPDGVWLEYDGPLVMCESGLHLSLTPWDALNYAPGGTICLVRFAGVVIPDTDKLVCSKRMIVKRFDATVILREFARKQALSVIHLWDAPQVVKDYLQTGDESLRADAWEAAWADAWEATWAAAGPAAGAAARDAAWAAAGNMFNEMVYAEFAK